MNTITKLVLTYSTLTTLRSKQRGISLVIVLMFLVILSVLGISIIQGSSFGARIARNEADRNLSFQAAEAALRDAEADIKYIKADGSLCAAGVAPCRPEAINGSSFDTSCTNGLCEYNTTAPVWETSSRWASGGASVAYGTYTSASALPLVSQQPRYLIEYFKLGESTILRVTAMGYGASASTKTMLQTALKVRI